MFVIMVMILKAVGSSLLNEMLMKIQKYFKVDYDGLYVMCMRLKSISLVTLRLSWKSVSVSGKSVDGLCHFC